MSMISFLKCICWFCYSLNIFSNHFDCYCLMSINYFLRNGAKRSQKRTFVRRQWAQYLPFLLFTQHLFQSFWLLLFDVNQLFSQKWSPKLLKANFCSKTVGTVFAVFVLHSTSFQINLVIIVWCQSIIFSEMKPGALKSKLLLEDSGHSICCFLFFFQHLSQSIWLLLFVLNQFFLRNRVRNS